MSKILCSISTRGRYETTLPLVIQSVAMQTMLPDHVVIFDDNDSPKDIRATQHYEYLLRILDEKSISWNVVFAERKGQHFNHQKANEMGFDFVWRLDDDTIAEPDVLYKLYSQMNNDVGAVGGSVLTPPFPKGIKSTGKIENVKTEPNIQWDYIKETIEVDHLHCTFLYRSNIANYDLSLSKVAHREETLFTYSIKLKGYKILVTPCVTWHLKNRSGGIRDGVAQMFEHDEKIFNTFLNANNINSDCKIVVLDNGIGDHYAFKNILPELRSKHNKIVLAVCYPDVFWDEEGINIISISDAINICGDIGIFNIYKWMDTTSFHGNLVEAFRSMYL